MLKIVQQLPDALDLIAGPQAGHAFPSGLQMVGEETQDPIAGEFRIVHDEINFGIAVPTALANLAHRVPIPDMRHFVIAVLIQRETGGNLTELLGEHRQADPRAPEAARLSPRDCRRREDCRPGSFARCLRP